MALKVGKLSLHFVTVLLYYYVLSFERSGAQGEALSEAKRVLNFFDSQGTPKRARFGRECAEKNVLDK